MHNKRLLLLFLFASCTSANRRSAVQLPASSIATLDTVRVRGKIVHVSIAGTSGPSVVLISGMGDGLRPWGDVQHGVAQFARVLSYDRLGLGKSDEVAAPRTISRMTDELHALLPLTGLQPPYVIVGHSLGGFVAQLYAAKYPDEVRGLVLVDPSILGFYLGANSLAAFRDITAQQKAQLATAPPGVRAEFDAIDADLDEMRLAPPIPKVPTVLLTSIHHAPPSAVTSALDSIWLAEHVRWAHDHPGTRQVVDSVHGHYLQRETPGAVIEAIRSVSK